LGLEISGAGVPFARGSGPFASLTIGAVLTETNKRALLWAALLAAAFAVGFGLGVILWEGGSAPQGPPRGGIDASS